MSIEYWRCILEPFILIGLRDTVIHSTAYLSSDFACRRWWNSCAKNYLACFLNSKIFADFKLDFICSNLCFAGNPLSTLLDFFWYSYPMNLFVSNYTDFISFWEHLLQQFFWRNLKPIYHECQEQKEPWVCWFGSLLKMH